MAEAVSAQASALRDEMTTLAPCSASRSAMARPMPREEPVTMATRPLRSNRLIKASSRKRSRRWSSKPIPNLAKSSKAGTKRSKDDQRKRLGFSCISLSASSLFNRLRRPPGHFFFCSGFAPVKSIAILYNLRRDVRRPSAPGRARDVDRSGHGERSLARASIFRKQLFEKLAIHFLSEPAPQRATGADEFPVACWQTMTAGVHSNKVLRDLSARGTHIGLVGIVGREGSKREEGGLSSLERACGVAARFSGGAHLGGEIRRQRSACCAFARGVALPDRRDGQRVCAGSAARVRLWPRLSRRGMAQSAH